MPDKVLQHDQIGEVLIRRRASLKRISLRIEKNGSIRLNIPFFVSEKRGVRFLESKIDWITRNQNKIKIRNKAKEIHIGFSLKLITRTLYIGSTSENTRQIEIDPQKDCTYIKVPQGVDISSENLQNHLKTLLTKLTKEEAQKYLPQRLSCLSQQSGLMYNTVKLRNQKSIWGSCSYTNNISLNIQLMRLPVHLADYVMMHELCHTKEKNHSYHFWKLLESKLDTDPLILRKEMKHYSLTI